MHLSASEEYTQRLRIREARARHHANQDVRIGNVRLLVFAAAAIVGWLSLQRHLFSPLWLSVALATFIGAVLYHQAVRRAFSRAERVMAFYRAGLARIQDNWMGHGQRGERFNDPHHVYAADLDLFGNASLFELLSLARTRMGEEMLAQWLLAPSPRATILERQAAVTDLRDRLGLREDLAVMGEDSKAAVVYPQALLEWAELPNQLQHCWIRWASLVLPVLVCAAAIVWGVWGISTPFFLVLLIEAGITYSLKQQLHEVLSGTENAFEDLKLLSALLMRLEREQFQAPLLQALVRKLSSHALNASHAIARLNKIAGFVEARRNPIVAVLQVPLMYAVSVALAAERWRRDHGKVVRSWIDAVGEFEALVSMAAYSYEHRDDPFPEFVDEPAVFEGMELGHPLIPTAQCVRNDVDLTGKTRVLLVSGSNMSGKSTLLRAVGVNTVLAMAGAPVRARRLRLTPLQVGASIRANDSLREGSSRFYAEITRLRQLYDLVDRDLPLLFLLDELLQGTNSKDRRIGAEGIIGAFVERHAIGLVSTHDLVLTDISALKDGQLRNVHFQDELENGIMKFDFKLRDGVVTKSNGVELMRAIGLKV